jgi:protoporphyrinogen oxidase
LTPFSPERYFAPTCEVRGVSELHPHLIAGGGLTGLSIAFHLGSGYALLEKEERVGGLARTLEAQGFRFDQTGHNFQVRDPYVRSLLMRRLAPAGWRRIRRHWSIYTHGVCTPYPFQASTYGLPPSVIKECVLGFLGAPGRGNDREDDAPETFEEWVHHRFGSGIARHFLLPYNEKLWGIPAREIQRRWCDRFVPQPRLEEVVAGAVAPAASEPPFFFYPEGGIEGLPRALARRLRGVRTGTEVRQVRWRDRTVVLAGGSEIGYGRLVSTLPLPELMKRLHPAPPEAVRREARALRHTSVLYLHFGVRGEAPYPAQRIYVPDRKLPFYRVGFPSNVDPAMAPEGHHAMTVEVSHRGPLDLARARERVERGLRAAGFLGRDSDVVVAQASQVPYAYVLFDGRYQKARAACLRFLAGSSILSAGRYGGWVYSSMEDALLEGRALAERLRTDRPHGETHA